MRIEERALFHGEPVGQFHQHLRRPGLGGVQSAGEHVDGLGLGDDLPGLIGGEPARIGEFGEVAFVRVQIADGLLVGDGDHQAFAAFIGGADGQQLDALGCGGERAIILAELGHLGELLGSAGVVAQDVLGGRHPRRLGQVVHQRAHEFGGRGPFLDQPGIFLVHRLFGLGQGQGGGDDRSAIARDNFMGSLRAAASRHIYTR